MSPEDINRAVELAVLREQFKALNDHVARLERSIEDMNSKLDTVLGTLDEARGGWKVLMGVGGAASLVTGALLWAVERLLKL